MGRWRQSRQIHLENCPVRHEAAVTRPVTHDLFIQPTMLTLFPALANREIRITAAGFNRGPTVPGPPDIKVFPAVQRKGDIPAWSRCVTDGTLCCPWFLLRSIDPAAFCATPILSEETKHRRMKGGWGVGGVVQLFRELLQGEKSHHW